MKFCNFLRSLSWILMTLPKVPLIHHKQLQLILQVITWVADEMCDKKEDHTRVWLKFF